MKRKWIVLSAVILMMAGITAFVQGCGKSDGSAPEDDAEIVGAQS